MKLLAVLILILALSAHNIYAQQNIIDATIEKAKENIWSRYKDNHWNYPTFLGTMFLSCYYMESQAMGWSLERTGFDVQRHKTNVLNEQLPNGAWQQVPSENEGNESIDATIMHYWFLKMVGDDINAPHMVKARNFILQNGGIENAQQMTRYKMALYGQYDWADSYYIPLLIFDKDHPLAYFAYSRNIVAQWVYPHITAFGYLRYFRIFNQQGPSLFEIYSNPPKDGKLNLSQRETGAEPDESVVKLVEEMISLRRPKGSIGTYTVSTQLNLFCFKHFIESWPNHKFVPTLKEMIEEGFKFIQMNIFNEISPYTGQLDDGRWWDTLLVQWALLEAGEDEDKLIDSLDKLTTDAWQENGGIAYGWDFEYAPDADDTSVYIQNIGLLKKPENKARYQKNLEKSKEFMQWAQNNDGGVPAFDHEFQGNWYFKLGMKVLDLEKSAEIFDPSCPDITGHMFEAYAANGIDKSNPYIQKGIQFLEKSYTNFENGYIAWQGRWGINYIYSSGTVLQGLRKVGYNMKSDIIARNVAWLVARQNADGGFGENHLSYNDPVKWNGRGKSTPTQTAWGLMGLIAVHEHYDVKENIERGIEYLLNNFWETNEGFWFDKTVVGSGHRGMVYLQYPAYANSFPLIALGRYREILQKGYSNFDKLDNLQQRIDKILKDTKSEL